MTSILKINPLCRVLVIFCAALVHAMTKFAYAAEREVSGRVLGEWRIFRSYDRPVCEAMTKNLNRFRGIPPEECHPRLAQGFGFSRPEWVRLPYEEDLVRKIRGAKVMDDWLKNTQAALSAGKVGLWRTEVDIDNNGKLDTLYKLDYGRWEEPARACTYTGGRLYTSIADTEPSGHAAVHAVNNSQDVVFFDKNKFYYLLNWDIGYAASIYEIGSVDNRIKNAVEVIRVSGELGQGPDCVLGWIPAGTKIRINTK